jgi:hypothetical protein
LNDAGAATDSTRALSSPSAFLAFFGEKSLKSFSCPLACNTSDNLFSAAAGAFIHWNSPILPSLPGRFTFPAQLRSALLWIALPQQLRHQFAADAQVGGTPETSFARGTIEV